MRLSISSSGANDPVVSITVLVLPVLLFSIIHLNSVLGITTNTDWFVGNYIIVYKVTLLRRYDPYFIILCNMG